MISGRIYVTESQIICGSKNGDAAVLYPVSGEYVHPASKQCNWTPDLSNYATKTELNEVIDMIESSQGPVVVGGGAEDDVKNGGKPIYISINSCNYVVVTITNPPSGYNNTSTIYKGSSATLYLRVNTALYRQTFSLNSSGTQLTVTAEDPSDYDAVNVRAFSWTAYR